MHLVSFIYTNFGQFPPWQRYHTASLWMESCKYFQARYFVCDAPFALCFNNALIHARHDVLLLTKCFDVQLLQSSIYQRYVSFTVIFKN